MKNFSVQVDGKEYWISRSVAVCGFIFTISNGLRVLAVKRGKGCTDEAGKWCCPCGYLDYDETFDEALYREVKEETNLVLNPDCTRMVSIWDSPKVNRQNIVVNFFSFHIKYAWQILTGAFGEKDEVEDVQWIRLKDLDKFDWAFGHKETILHYAKQIDLYA